MQNDAKVRTPPSAIERRWVRDLSLPRPDGPNWTFPRSGYGVAFVVPGWNSSCPLRGDRLEKWLKTRYAGGCSDTASAVERYWQYAADNGVEICLVSGQPLEEIARAMRERSLSAPFLSDEDGKLLETLGMEDQRWTFNGHWFHPRFTVVTQRGRVVRAVTKIAHPGRHVREVLATLIELAD